MSKTPFRFLASKSKVGVQVVTIMLEKYMNSLTERDALQVYIFHVMP